MRELRITGRVALMTMGLALIGWIVGCGPKAEPAHPRARARVAPRREAQPPEARRSEDVQIKGLRGTIDTAAVERAFEAKINAVRACRRQHLDGLTYVGGEVQFFFKIGTDGVPTYVALERSQLGRYELEACLLAVARSLRFVKPEGGVAEVRYVMQLANEGTDAVDWPASKAARVMRGKAGVIRGCRRGGRPRHFAVTFYVLPGGKVQTAGVASKEALPDGFAACVAKIVTAATFPDPLGDVARVTYAL